jgi:hypothetical protein
MNAGHTRLRNAGKYPSERVAAAIATPDRKTLELIFEQRPRKENRK